MDEDLETMTREALVAEVRRLRQGIRAHRDSSGHDLCWYHPELWALLPERTEANIKVPEWPQFLQGCVRYRQSLDSQAAQVPRSEREYDPRIPPRQQLHDCRFSKMKVWRSEWPKDHCPFCGEKLPPAGDEALGLTQ
jgi:hypothetical protein